MADRPSWVPDGAGKWLLVGRFRFFQQADIWLEQLIHMPIRVNDPVDGAILDALWESQKELTTLREEVKVLEEGRAKVARHLRTMFEGEVVEHGFQNFYKPDLFLVRAALSSNGGEG